MGIPYQDMCRTDVTSSLKYNYPADTLRINDVIITSSVVWVIAKLQKSEFTPTLASVM